MNVGSGAGSTAVTLLHIIGAHPHRDGDILEILLEPHSGTEGVLMRKSEKKKAESSAKVAISTTLAVIIQDKSNKLCYLHSTCRPHVINPPRTMADVTSTVVH